MRLIIIPILFLVFFIVGSSTLPSSSVLRKDKVRQDKMLERHNQYRGLLELPPLEWSDELAAYAQDWADHLAETGCGLMHSDGSYGENIYWTSGKASEEDVVDYWAKEMEYFNDENPIFEKDKLNKYGHYTQIIWRDTKFMGAGKAICSNGNQIWVCVYDPAGNIIDEPVY